MRNGLLIFLVFGWLSGRQTIHAQAQDTLLRLEAAPSSGYDYPFFVYIPSGCSRVFEVTLLVEPNNTGIINDSLAVHEKAAREQAIRGPLGHELAARLHMPLLVPVFPKPGKDWKIYTHMLDRDAMRVKKGPLKRLDLQLLAMINQAREKLFEMGYRSKQQVLMTGYSSAGVFCNRFACLHPVWVKGYAAGGINGLLLMPFATLDGATLRYPLGIADFEKIKGEPFDLSAFRQVRQFLYMGAGDTNDAVAFKDGYRDRERKIIYRHFGKSMPERWIQCQEQYRQAGMQATCKTYVGTGHGIHKELIEDLVAFFMELLP